VIRVNALDDDQRWAIARQLPHDTTIDTEDRLAGLPPLSTPKAHRLSLCYAADVSCRSRPQRAEHTDRR
jgi:hypothetical protein